MPTYRLNLEYEGTRYRGWQEQKNARTVSGVLRDAIEKVAGRVADLGGSGRTDAGVHALMQVAHVRVHRAMAPEHLREAVNEELPPDIHIVSAGAAHERFHARHSALSRSYIYQISRRRTAFAKRFVWWVRSPLDAAAMRAAAELVPGRHDFSLFCERPQEQTSTIVVVDRVEIQEAGSLVLVRLSASHFLWRMVRRVVGTLVEVGSGRLDVKAFAGMIGGGGPGPAVDEGPAKWTAPPSGLFLERVLYPGDPPLGSLAPAFPVSAPEPAAVPSTSAPRGRDQRDRRQTRWHGAKPRRRD